MLSLFIARKFKERRMKFLKQAKYVYLLLSVLTVGIVLGFAGYFLIQKRKTALEEQSKQEIRQNVKQLKAAISVHETGNLHRVTAAERIAFLYLSEMKQFTELSFDSISVPAVVDADGSTVFFDLNQLLLSGKPAYKNTELINTIQYLSNTYVSIWQQNENGYIRIVSNLPDAVKNPGLTRFLHNGSKIVSKIEDGKKYYKRESVGFDSRYSVYRPVTLKGYIKLIIQISIDERTHTAIGNIFSNNRFYRNEQLFFLNSDDSTIINTKLNKKFFNDAALIKKIHIEKAEYNTVKHQVYKAGELREYMISFSVMPDDKRIAGVILPKNEYYNGLQQYALQLTLILLLAGVVIVSILQFLQQADYKFLKHMKSVLNQFSQGIYTEAYREMNYRDPDKADIIRSLKEISSYYRNNSEYVTALSESDYQREIKPTGEHDTIGNSLLSLRNELDRLEKEQNRQAESEKLRRKITEGQNKINAILQYASDSDDFFKRLIRTIVDFLEVDQAGLFLVERPDDETRFMELKAHYAYGEERIAEKQLSVNEGLTGRCYLEKKRIILKEIPKNYTKLKSGFGETEPHNIALIPLIFNNEVQAVLEISALSDIEDYKINFLENIGESIASTFSNINNTRRTAELLEQTKDQATQIETQRIQLQERIDTHRRQNKKLDKQLLEYQEIINSLKIGTNVVEFDTSGKIISVNERSAMLIGTTSEELLGKTYQILFDQTFPAIEHQTLWKDLKSGKSIEQLELLLLKDGSKKEVYVHYIPIRNARRRFFRVLSILSVHYEAQKSEK